MDIKERLIDIIKELEKYTIELDMSIDIEVSPWSTSKITHYKFIDMPGFNVMEEHDNQWLPASEEEHNGISLIQKVCIRKNKESA